jgi:uncharacterized protein
MPTRCDVAPPVRELWCAGRRLAAGVIEARGFWARGLGLMFRRSWPSGRVLRLDPCGSVHTACMRFPIDVVFTDAANRVVRVARGVRPWRIALGGPGARVAWEWTAGAAGLDALRPGDVVEQVNRPS